MSRPFKKTKSNIAVERQVIPPTPEKDDEDDLRHRTEKVTVRSATTGSSKFGLQRTAYVLTLNISPSHTSAPHPSNPSEPESFTSLDAVNDNIHAAEDQSSFDSIGPDAPPYTKDDGQYSSWYKYDRDIFLAGIMYNEGRGMASMQKRCGRCMSPRFSYHCQDCFNSALFCRDCIIDMHAGLPFHKIRKWNGHCFERATLKDIGLRIQMGHPTNVVCPCPRSTPWDDFVVLDVDSQHTVNLDFCGCASGVDHARQLLHSGLFPATSSNPKTAVTFRLLKFLCFLSAEGTISTWEMYQSIRRGTDNTGFGDVPNRYHSLLDVLRQWQHLILLKRAGKGHALAGVADVRAGDLAILCPACPQFGINTTEKPPNDRWLNALFIGMDGNFRLKRFDVSSMEKDPPLNNGGAYMVGMSEYEAFLSSFSDMTLEPKSSCHDFKAIRDANTVAGKRVAVNGIATVDCIRHGLKRPASMADIPRGERYVHMDYALFSTLPPGQDLGSVFVSYDIGCQYGVNLWNRRKGLPPILDAMSHDPAKFTMLVPKFHLPAHVEDCRLNYSFNTTVGVGRTDGEAPERNWSYLDRFAGSTRQMGPGSRADFLDYLDSGLNWRKFTDMPSALGKKLVVAITQSAEHTRAFQELSSTMQEDNLRLWKAQVTAWERDKSKPNPFRLDRENVPSERAVRLRILREEQDSVLRGDMISLDNNSSPFGFLTAGIDLEELQYLLDHDASMLGDHSTDIQRAKIVKRGMGLVTKLKTWLQLQRLYFPEGASLQMQGEILGGEDAPSVKTKLFLPSQIPLESTCNPQLVQYEWDLRIAQAHDALDLIRTHICSLYSVRKFTDRFFRGQKAGTRSQEMKSSLQERIQYSAAHYRRVRNSLSRLSIRLGKPIPPALQELQAKDLRHIHEGEIGQSEGGRLTSWIWLVVGGSHGAGDDKELRNELRVEWCLSRARAARWAEEVQLLREEMQRVLRFYTWKAAKWNAVFEQGQYKPLDVDYRPLLVDEGRRAYAKRQQLLYESLGAHCRSVWASVSSSGVVAGPVSTVVNSGEDKMHCDD